MPEWGASVVPEFCPRSRRSGSISAYCLRLPIRVDTGRSAAMCHTQLPDQKSRCGGSFRTTPLDSGFTACLCLPGMGRPTPEHGKCDGGTHRMPPSEAFTTVRRPNQPLHLTGAALRFLATQCFTSGPGSLSLSFDGWAQRLDIVNAEDARAFERGSRQQLSVPSVSTAVPKWVHDV